MSGQNQKQGGSDAQNKEHTIGGNVSQTVKDSYDRFRRERGVSKSEAFRRAFERGLEEMGYLDNNQDTFFAYVLRHVAHAFAIVSGFWVGTSIIWEADWLLPAAVMGVLAFLCVELAEQEPIITEKIVVRVRKWSETA